MWGTIAALVAPGAAPAQRDTVPPVPLRPITVSVSRGDLPPDSLPFSSATVRGARVATARPTWGLDEALGTVPGVFVANRYNFSLDQRVSIRGFGARSAFAVRGIKVLIDGVPQTLPDGQGQLTTLELGMVEQVEVLRGAASALYGNAAGGVISVTTSDLPRAGWTQDVRVTAGTVERSRERAWHKWQLRTGWPLGPGAAQVYAARLAYDGQRDYSAADLRSLGVRLVLPLRVGWTVRASLDVGDQPRAENPGALTLAELEADRDAAAPANVMQGAGKDVTQLQGAVTARRHWTTGAELSLTAFGITRRLDNPVTFAWIRLDRRAGGVRAVLTQPLGAAKAHRLTLGLDLQNQRDDRVNQVNAGGVPDTTRLLDQVEHVTELGPFAQVTLAPMVGVRVTLGARVDVVRFRASDRLVTATNPDDSGERRMAAASGSAGVTWTLATRTVLYASGGTSFETPTTTELTNRPGSAGGINDSLGPQRAWMLDAGLRWASEAVRASVAVFHADVRDELIPFEVPTAPQRRFFRNAGRATHRGIEVAVDGRLWRWVRGVVSYTFADYRYRDFAVPDDTGRIVVNGRRLPGLPVHRGQAILEARPPGRWPWADLELGGTGSVLVDDTLETRASAWWLVNLRVGASARAGRWHIAPFLGILNLLDRAAVGSVVINASGGRYYEPAPGRSGYLGVTLSGGR